jgi:hypothetical protein
MIVKHLNFVVKSLVGIVVLVLLVGVWVSPAAADSPGEREYIGLEYALKHTLLRPDVLQAHIDYATGVADLAQEYIQAEQAAGYDTSALEAALTETLGKIAEAQALHGEAVQILEEKVGFDEYGQVVEPQQARDTLKEARQTIQEANQTLRTAKQDFRQALRDYRQSKRNG